MGSKRKYKNDILPILNKYIKDNNINCFVDCFCGGANLCDGIECDRIIANDLSPTLIALHKQMQMDSTAIPTTGNREMWDKYYTEYKRLKKSFPIEYGVWEKESSIPLWKIGTMEWYCSYSNGGFSRGFAKPSDTRDYYNEAYRNHIKQNENPIYGKIEFRQGDYRNIDIPENSILYCDSPYKSTKPYQIETKFNFEEYYNWLRETSKYYPIFISEQSMPEDFDCIWEKQATRTTNKENNFKAVEKLFFIDNRNK